MFPGPSFYPVTSMFTGPFNGPGFHAGCLQGSASKPTVKLHPCSNTAPAFLGRDFASLVRLGDGGLEVTLYLQVQREGEGEFLSELPQSKPNPAIEEIYVYITL